VFVGRSISKSEGSWSNPNASFETNIQSQQKVNAGFHSLLVGKLSLSLSLSLSSPLSPTDELL